MKSPPLDFAYGYLTRSGRMDAVRARSVAPSFMAEYDAAVLASTADPVDEVTETSKAVGFLRSEHANCSAILWDNLERNPDKLAVVGPAGSLTYAQLVASAAQWGNAFMRFGLRRGDRIPVLSGRYASLSSRLFRRGTRRAGTGAA